jgi:L-threonylcarbamoyladenylate synthase
MILRPGSVTRQQIESCIGPVEAFAGAVSASTAAAGPGMQAVHYAPRAAAYQFDALQRGQVEAWCGKHAAERWTVLPLGTNHSPGLMEQARQAAGRWLEMPRDAADYAHCLYDLLHLLDDQGMATIWIEMPPDGADWAAVRDRLQRATRPPGFE